MPPRAWTPLAALLAVLLLAPAFAAPDGAQHKDLAGEAVAVWVGSDALRANTTMVPGSRGIFSVELGPIPSGNASGNATPARRIVALNVTPNQFAFDATSANATIEPGSNRTTLLSLNFTTPAGSGVATFTYTLDASETRNGTPVSLGTTADFVRITLSTGALVPAPGPSIPLPVILVGALVVLGGAAWGAYAWRQASVRRRMNAAPRRSAVMRDAQLEREMERARQPARVAEIRQEMRAQEQVREKRRELQILEAKRADAEKSLELLRKRHESGALSRLQHDTMAAKKREELAKLDAEIARERDGPSG